jgi:redox-sensing transcriptional repressor
MMTETTISKTLLRRLPLYLQYMKQARTRGLTYVSATEMAAALGVHHTQVRKDLDSVGVAGTPKIGHPLAASITAVESFLGWNDQSSAFLIGVGNLGRALLGYKHFAQAGIKILAAFDNDGRKAGTTVCGTEVFPITKFVNLVQRMHINIAILTTPPDAAPDVSQLLIESGVKAVWNFVPTTLKLPPHIIVENADLFSSFAILSHKLKDRIEIASSVV